MNGLVVCPECSRHIRRTEASCPFCGSAVSPTVAGAPPRPMPTQRLSRAALFTFAAASIGAAACSSSDDTGKGNQPVTDGAAGDGDDGSGGNMGVPLYGAPATGGLDGAGGTASTGGASAGGSGGEMAVPLYGAPATGGTKSDVDSGMPAAGGYAALYGLPPKP